eukprot:CAMPEP_0178887910 /NCGR_PEP_ID=MMETSP0747-20121128/16877_1 /TAXON_ID=913974 /ORGANISM="Nitzschia punctata, Strain CCMP561" /LENGTH=43 /DNA_ID= /DNA_START= /DNA_END= /DNA_ORIENTATION=
MFKEVVSLLLNAAGVKDDVEVVNAAPVVAATAATATGRNFMMK